ncbi:hypothetical protein PISL3812_08136 [Talaromyces islandicus]|uniref:BTB domain-containing protein n=1 Tax=Talaromyces islandicus TaxID=28573 RepID=A0A0U1M674_TALIS|nr:hypothetical protein PISL3812_08136 [Talaromyces islandicus]
MEEKRPDVDEAADQRADLEHLDPEGDVMLKLEDGEAARNFLVSSKILSLASPVFKTLFAPSFSEGTKLAELGYIEVSLHDDNPCAMRSMLAILHYQDATELDGADPKAIATFAICCDKYDCVKPIRPWVEAWFHNRLCISTAEDYGLILLAAHLFRSSEQFSSISAQIIRKMSPEFSTTWEANDILAFLPSIVIGETE